MKLLTLITAIPLLETALGFFVLLKKPKSLIHQCFFLICVSVGIWSFAIGLLITPGEILSSEMYEVFGRSMYFMGFVVSSSMLLFAWTFPTQVRKTSAWQIAWLTLPILVLAFVFFWTDWIIQGIHPRADTVAQIEYNFIGNLVFSLVFLLNIFWAIAIFTNKYRKSRGVTKKQIAYVGFGFFVTLLFSALFDVILPLFGNLDLVFISPAFSAVFLGFVSFSILRYRLLDIVIIIKRTSLYLALVAIITGLYTFILILPQSFLGLSGRGISILTTIAAAVIIGVTLQPLKDWLDRVTDKIFFQKKYNYYQVLERLARELSTLIKVEDVVRTVAETLLDALHLDKVGIYLHGQVGRSDFVCLEKRGETAGDLPLGLDDEDALITYLHRNRKLLVTGEFLHYQGYLFEPGRVVDENKAAVHRTLSDTMKIELIVPLWLKHSLIGFLALGNKRSGDQYTDRDLILLETISSQMAVVLENAKLYEQMLNSERLRVLGAMSASIAHEIRNPLAAIKTFIQMLPNKYEQPEFRMRFNEIVPVEIERLTRITGDLLTFSRPSPPTLMPTEINTLLDRVVTLLGNQVRKKQVSIHTEYGLMDPVQADGQQLTQVFMNLVLNAIQASAENGRIWLSTAIKSRSGGPEDLQQVVVEVRDEGCGIKPKDMPNIFEPFFTTKHEGTGLGLATSRRIVELHYGQIFVTSEEGKGTTFTVNLPILQPEVERVANTN